MNAETALRVASVMMLFATLALTAWVAFTRGHRSRADALGLTLDWPLPRFELKDQAGRTFSSQALSGKVAVVDFIYTRCGASCPTLTASLASLLRKFPGDARVEGVSISVDPRHDTPEVLARYARGFQADPARWEFLSGDPHVVADLIGKGFKLPFVEVQVEEKGNQVVDIPHTSSVAVVDRQGRIRAYYEGVEEGNWPRLESAVRALLEE